MRYCWLTVPSLLVLAAGVFAQPTEGLLLHYGCDEGQGKVVADSSGNGLDGAVTAGWAASPSGQSLALDGQPAGIVRVQLPEDKRFGKESWTLSAWLKPTQFAIEDRQNQRRLFGCGVYPDAYLVIDLMSKGQASFYFCYRNEAGAVVSAGGTAATGLPLGEWSHLALVVDRTRGQAQFYLNGYSQGTVTLPAAFAGDFSRGGELTLGNGWHNYWGLLDEVLIYRRALPRAEVKAEFVRLKETFGVQESPAAAAAERREALMEAFGKTAELWTAKDFAGVRAACSALVASPDASPALRSYAQLRAAQSYTAEGDTTGARAEYEKIAATAEYPEVHRAEARDCLAEFARREKGLPACDPAASRTVVPPAGRFAAELFVGPKGNDGNAGTAASPLATLTRARDIIRARRERGVRGAAAVNVLPGTYRVTAPFRLGAEDSGVGGPVVYRAVEPGKAVFYGGQRLTGFAPVTEAAVLARLPEEARGKVQCCDLKAAGVTDYGALAVRGFGQPPSPPTLEVYVDGRPMTLARWPNEGFVGIGKLLQPGNRAEKQASVLEYLDDRHARWTQAEEPWLFGYFRYLWADGTIRVSRIDPAAHTLTCDEAYQYGAPGMDTGQGIQYYAFNLLEEIDRPGEFYLDRRTGVLYLYPPTDLAQATVEVGLLSQPMVTLEGVSDVRLEGLAFDLGRYDGLVLQDCRRCLVAGCTVSRLAGNGITVQGGEACGLLGCDVHTIGRRATEVIGGDRATLTPGRHFVENCCLHDFGRLDRTYTPAIQLEGVGNRVAHNFMYDCPSSVMRIEGNDHVIEYNEVHNAVRESDDQGAMELFRNPTYRGVVFRYNRFINCGKTGTGAAVHGQAAIRFDDAISGMLVYGNVFIRSANGHFGAVQMNSGRDNIMDNNLFIDCKQGISGGWNAGNSVWRMLAENQRPEDFFVDALYLKRYPEIATMMEAPGVNHVWRNVFYRCGTLATSHSNLDLMGNGDFGEEDLGFVNAAGGDYALRPEAALWARVGFKPLPLEEIGLYEDTYRASWPVEAPLLPVPEWRAPAGAK